MTAITPHHGLMMSVEGSRYILVDKVILVHHWPCSSSAKTDNRQVNDSGCSVDMDGLLAAFMDYMFDTHFILLSSPLSQSISLVAMNNSDEHVRAQQDGHACRDRVRLQKLIADEQHGESQQREYRLGIQHDGEVS